MNFKLPSEFEANDEILVLGLVEGFEIEPQCIFYNDFFQTSEDQSSFAFTSTKGPINMKNPKVLQLVLLLLILILYSLGNGAFYMKYANA